MTEYLLHAAVLDNVLLGNSVRQYLLTALYFVALILLFKLIQSVVLVRLRQVAAHTRTDIDDVVIDIVASVRPSLYVVLAVYGAVRSLALPPLAVTVVNFAALAAVVYQSITVIHVLIDYLVRRRERTVPEGSSSAVAHFVSRLVKIALWITGILFVLSNLGLNVTSLVAGLGVGGIAVALAAQNILGDLFSSLAIYFDQPFQVGDFIVVGDVHGTVKKVGIKTTRIQSLDGEEIVVPNRELTSDRIKNYRRMEERRVAFDVAVVYQTSIPTLERIPAIIQGVIDSVPHTRFGRAHLHRLDPSAYSFKVVFYVKNRSFEQYMDARQEINLKLLHAFKQAHIHLAYPTQTVHLAREKIVR